MGSSFPKTANAGNITHCRQIFSKKSIERLARLLSANVDFAMPIETVTVSFRAERDFVVRLEAVLEQMKREMPGARLKLSDAIRATLLEGLRARERRRRKKR
jgi:hypothetical protein